MLPPHSDEYPKSVCLSKDLTLAHTRVPLEGATRNFKKPDDRLSTGRNLAKEFAGIGTIAEFPVQRWLVVVWLAVVSSADGLYAVCALSVYF